MKRIVFIAFLFLCVTICKGQELSSQESAKKELDKNIALIEKQLSSTQGKKQKTITELVLIQKKIETRKDILNDLDTKIKGYDRAIEQKNQEILATQNRLDTLMAHYSKFVLSFYKNRNPKVWFMYIVASENISQGVRRWSYFKNMSQSIEQQAENIKQVEKELSTQKEKLGTLKLSSVNAKNDKQKELSSLKKEEDQNKNITAQLSRREREIKKKLETQRKEAERLQREIEKILAEAAKQTTATGEAPKVDYALSGKFQDNKGKLPWPISSGVIISKFGQSHQISKNAKTPPNDGVDFSTETNAQVRSIFDGVVKRIMVLPGYNQCVLIQHGEYYTLYCKLKEVSVKNSQSIKAGEKIGIVDDNPEGASILHFQLWKGKVKQNPSLWLSSR